MKVLLVDDDCVFTQLLAYAIQDGEPGAEVYQAHTTADARRLFKAHPDVDTIVMDGCVPGREFNTLGLIGDIMAWGFDGLMIATSSSDTIRAKMLQAGCDVEMTKEKLLGSFLVHPV